jgi:hypothetical protein
MCTEVVRGWSVDIAEDSGSNIENITSHMWKYLNILDIPVP